jgi:two-component system, OmpR family, phosphate regulon sensor histidine kinase PhoR
MRTLRRWVWQVSLRRQLVVGVALIHLLVMTSFVFGLVHRQKAFLVERAERRVLFQAELLAATSLHAVVSNDRARLAEILAALVRDAGGVQAAMITDRRGLVLAHSQPGQSGRLLDDAPSRAILAEAPRARVVARGEPTFDAAAPVTTLQGRHLGWTWVAGDVAAERAHLDDVTRAGLAYTAVATLIVTAFALGLARAILRPLGLLVAGTEQISRQRWEQPIPVTTANEVGAVTHALNTMAETLRQRDAAAARAEAALSTLAHDLETQVEERTRKLTDERAQFEAILSGIGEGVCVTDTAGRVLMWNRAAEQITRVPAALMVGAVIPGPLRITHRDRVVQDFTRTLMKHAIDRGEPVSTSATKLTRLDGSVVSIGMTAAPVRDPDGAVQACVNVFRDVTRERDIDRMKSEFVSAVSHELRTPLTSIRAYAETLRDIVGDEAIVQEFLTVIEEEAVRLTRLINDLLNLSRIESGRIQFKRESVVLAPIVARAIQTTDPKAAMNGVRVAADIPSDLPPFHGDADGIQQVLTNLVDNGVKYNRPGGRVEVRARLNGGVRVEVSDTGLGMSPEAVRRLGERFFRVDSSETRRVGGTGLGMSLVKEILHAHDAVLQVESTEGRGSVFWFVLAAAGDGA